MILYIFKIIIKIFLKENNKIKKKKVKSLTAFILISIPIIILSLIFFVFLTNSWIREHIRFDQYMSTICSTTAAVVITLFGLSAASYAFVCSELRTEEKNLPHLSRIISKYRQKLWEFFVSSLILSVVSVIISIISLGLAQNISSEELFETSNYLIYTYANSKFQLLSFLTFCTIIFTIYTILIMALFNWRIFHRENSYSKIAKALCNESLQAYKAPENGNKLKGNENELEKIHNLETLINRIVKNHEGIGDSYSPEHRVEQLLKSLLKKKLKNGFYIEDTNGNRCWSSISNDAKKESQWERCKKEAKNNIEYLNQKYFDNSTIIDKQTPSNYSFIKVYFDLICYRNCRLVYTSNFINNSENGNCLRWSIKKRLLLFLMWEETFSGMDLSGMSFSGGDLRKANFSNCDFTRVRLKGSNCEGADFSGSRMPGMYFSDVSGCEGEIQVTCIDDNKKIWDPYNGKEATCFHGATFAHADVSRACLLAENQNNREWGSSFPFDNEESNNKSSNLYSMEDTSFDYTKLFSSKFSNISFNKSNFQKALLFDSVFFQCTAHSANFVDSTLTNCCILCNDFYEANMSNSVMSQSILYRNNFRSSNLSNVNFAGANIFACNFSGSYCLHASFTGIIQDKGKIEKVINERNSFAKSCLKENERFIINFKYAILTSTDFSESEISNIDFSCTIGKNCIFAKSKGENCKFNDALLSSSILNNTKLSKASMNNTVLKNSVLTNCEFKNCQIIMADLSETLFIQSKNPCFINCILKKVDFSNAKGLSAKCFKNTYLENCNFTNTGITKKDLFNLNIKNNGCKFDNGKGCLWEF